MVVLDVLMKNETEHADMIAIMNTMQEYLGSDYDEEWIILSGADQVTCEHQIGS